MGAEVGIVGDGEVFLLQCTLNVRQTSSSIFGLADQICVFVGIVGL